MGWNCIARTVGLAAGLLVAAGCALHSSGGFWAGYRFFAPPAPTDPWSGKIRGWQARELALGDTERLGPAPASVSGHGVLAAAAPGGADLRAKYFAFRREQKRAVAAATAAWIQRESRTHYRPDGPVDHWATLGETLDRNGEDCDG